MPRRLTAALALVALLGACGQKGPLYLSPEPKAPLPAAVPTTTLTPVATMPPTPAIIK